MSLPDAHVRFRIKRIPVGRPLSTKRYLTDEETRKLFQGEVEITEKLDGKQVTKVLVDNTTAGFKVIIGGEYLKMKHSIFYNRLPDWFVPWDFVLQKGDKTVFANHNGKLRMAEKYGLVMAPVLFYGRTTLDDALKLLERKSSFGDETQEGIVVRNYPLGLSGKIVRHEFVAGIELKGHYLRRRGLTEMNRLAPKNS